MAYGPLCQCAFMSYGPRIQLKAPPISANRQLYDKPPPFTAPNGCEAPPPGAFTMYAFEVEEAKKDPLAASRSLPLEEPCYVFGSSQVFDGQVHDGHKSVNEQHACLYFTKGKWFVKSINGQVHLESMTLHPYMRDSDGKNPKRYTSTSNKKLETITPIDSKRRLSREMCLFRLGDSGRRFWVSGALPLKEGEVEEDAGGTGGRKKDKGEKDRDKDRREDRGRDREDAPRRDRDRNRSRSRRRR